MRGKHKPIFAPHVDTGDHVIVVNASKLHMTAGKAEKKLYLPPLRLSGGSAVTKLQRAARQSA